MQWCLLKIPKVQYRSSEYNQKYLWKILRRDTPKTASQKKLNMAYKNGKHP